MSPLERLLRLEIEFHRLTREGGVHAEPSGVHTSYALQSGYEGLMSQAGNVTAKEVKRLTQQLLVAGDPRDVLKAGDSVRGLFGISAVES